MKNISVQKDLDIACYNARIALRKSGALEQRDYTDAWRQLSLTSARKRRLEQEREIKSILR